MGIDYKAKNLDLLSYFKQNIDNRTMKLSKDFTFHWANWDRSSIMQKNIVEVGENTKLIHYLDTSLSSLKNKNVWLCNKMKAVQTTYYNLYESYLDSRLRITWFDRDEEILYSDVSEQGPFYSLSSMKWYSKDHYEKFILRKILSEQYPLRAFRINTDIKLDVKFDNHYKTHTENFSIHQLSDAGILFKVKDKNFFNKIKNSKMMDFYFPKSEICLYACEDNDKFLEQMEKVDFEKAPRNLRYQLNSEVIEKYSNEFNAKRSANNEFYFFARYEDFSPEGHEEELRMNFYFIVYHYKKMFEEQINEIEMSLNQNLKKAS